MIQILIVEDEKPISELIRISLKRAGYECSCAYVNAAFACCWWMPSRSFLPILTTDSASPPIRCIV